jgi:hypothetical protein
VLPLSPVPGQDVRSPVIGMSIAFLTRWAGIVSRRPNVSVQEIQLSLAQCLCLRRFTLTVTPPPVEIRHQHRRAGVVQVPERRNHRFRPRLKRNRRQALDFTTISRDSDGCFASRKREQVNIPETEGRVVVEIFQCQVETSVIGVFAGQRQCTIPQDSRVSG